MPTVESKLFYANGMEVAMSPYDISLKFMWQGSETSSTATPNTEVTDAIPSVLEAVTVSMSLSHAKSMLPSLFAMVAKYEETYGEIPVPPEFVERWKQFSGKK